MGAQAGTAGEDHVTTRRDARHQVTIGEDECWQLAASQPVGRVAFVKNDEALLLPVNHAVDGRTVVFRTAPGSKLAAAALVSPVTFEVDWYDADSRTGWSVLLRGSAELVAGTAELERLYGLDLEPWGTDPDQTEWVRVRPQHVTGRRVVP